MRMSGSLFSLWRATVVLWLSLLVPSGDAKIHTEVQAGPLYRVLGSPLSISCTVSGFLSESSNKQFEFSIQKPSFPEMNIISTEVDNFGYAVYQERVKTKDIRLTRSSPNSVFFEIENLQREDEGEYHCTVKNSEYTYNGKYSDSTTVKVIDNSLSVLSPVFTSLSFNEGDTLTLTCQAFSNTTQHTHLSFGWYLRRDGGTNVQPIISLNRDFTMSLGQGFEGRYQAGLISLDKLGGARFKLKMVNLEVTDQGNIYCLAEEWIQEPDVSWYPIVRMKGTEITMKVKAAEIIPDALSLMVRIFTHNATLQEEQELQLSCNIDALKLEGRFFSVAWLRGGVELARMGPTGIVSMGLEYGGRKMIRELSVTRTGNRNYNLILQRVRMEEQGEYKCRVWPEVRGLNGSFTQGASVESQSQPISISTTEREFSVRMNDFTSVTEGERLRLDCKVERVKDRLSVTWQHKSTSAAQFTNVISLSKDGVYHVSEMFASRTVRATRPLVDSFILEMDKVRTTDSGEYKCVVSEWTANQQAHIQSQTATVTVSPIVMKVSLISRNSKVTIGDNVELMCRIKGPKARLTVTWSLNCDTTSLDDILTVSSLGGIRWFAKQHRYQVKVETRNNEVIHYLQIIGASHKESGSYCCGLEVDIENSYRKLPLSNPVTVVVLNPESKLVLSSSSDIKGNINTDIEINCSVSSNSSSFAVYDVTWMLEEAENKTIIHSDQNSLITFGRGMEARSRQRISLRRTSGPSFVLTIRQAVTSDRGSYVCLVGEWLQNPHGDWYQLSRVSKTTKLTLTEPDNDLRLDKRMQPSVSTEANDVELKCDIISDAAAPSYFYKVTWFYTVQSSPTRNVSLVKLDHTGLLSYPGDKSLQKLKGRLGLSRPSHKSFILKIQRVCEEDSGSYWCQVEQYQLDLQGHWKQKASDIAGPITLRVNSTGNAKASSESGCHSLTWIIITIATVIISMFVILILVKKICSKAASGDKKAEKSLWQEQLHLKAID